MQSLRWLAVLTAAVLITACFFTWVSVEGTDYFVGGFDSSSNANFGKPGLFHVIFCSIYIFLAIANRIWSVRLGFFVSAFNLAWAARNFFVISACNGGVCPEKHTGLYVILFGSILLLVLTPFIQVKSPPKPKTEAPQP